MRVVVLIAVVRPRHTIAVVDCEVSVVFFHGAAVLQHLYIGVVSQKVRELFVSIHHVAVGVLSRLVVLEVAVENFNSGQAIEDFDGIRWKDTHLIIIKQLLTLLLKLHQPLSLPHIILELRYQQPLHAPIVILLLQYLWLLRPSLSLAPCSELDFEMSQVSLESLDLVDAACGCLGGVVVRGFGSGVGGAVWP